MRNVVRFVLLTAFVGAPTLAQEGPRAELFGGYEYVVPNPSGPGCHGFGTNLAYSLNNWLGAVGDFGISKETGVSTFHDVNYLFGPRFSYRSYGKVTPFAQVLFGKEIPL